MLGLINLLDILYAVIGLLFAAGAGAMMLMFAFIQITGRIALWMDVGRTYKERARLQEEVTQLKAALDTAITGISDPNAPLVTAVKVGQPGGD
ncbi:MAG TPA: hypothetical protein ENH62_05800 [Marinobacter sp.]|uniref:Uncharacterized protein n=1 Tax=marine sediment metagenome TaxID=412755 RepID=A0A0F9WD22_9ZZZZ|nr:hypothetical protein [Marinobacter sp.]